MVSSVPRNKSWDETRAEELDIDLAARVPANGLWGMRCVVVATSPLRSFRNNVQAAQTTLNGTAGPSEDNPSTAMVLGDGIQQIGARFNGKMGRMVFLPFIPTSQQQADIETWLRETPLVLTITPEPLPV